MEYLARQAFIVCSDGAPQVSKPAVVTAGTGGGEEDVGTGAGWVGTPVPVGAGVGQDGGIQVGGAGLVGGGCVGCPEGPGVTPDGCLPDDGCWPEDGAVLAAVPVGADCWVICRMPARTCMISSRPVPYVAVMAGALAGMATESCCSCAFCMIVPGAAGTSVPARLAPTAARKSVRSGIDRGPGVTGPPMLTVSARPTRCAGQSGLGPGVPR